MTFLQKHYDVVVVGAGPVGMLIGSLLKKAALNVVIIEKHVTRSTQSKASSMNAYSLAILHAAGVAEKFVAEGKPIHELAIYWNNQRIAGVNYRYLPSIYDYILGLSQSDTERLLEDHFLSYDGEICRSTEVINFVETENTIHVLTATGQSLTCNYLLGCDGSRSTVRKILDFDFIGVDIGVDCFMYDCRLEWTGDKENVHYFIKESSFFLIIPQANGNHRIIMKGEKIENDRVVSREKNEVEIYQQLADKYGPDGLRIKEICWESNFSFYNRLASRYHTDRVFLVGDSCHLFSPVGGLGMNTGFQDAFNLSWKLSGVIKGRYSKEVLRSYGTERRQLAQKLIASTDATTKLLLRIDRDERGLLQDWLPLMKNRKKMRVDRPRNFSGLAQQYESGQLIGEPAPLIGKIIPFVRLEVNGENQSTYDLIDGEHHLLIIRDQCAMQLTGLIRKGTTTIIEIATNEKNRDAITVLFSQGFDAVLVRPDGIICVQGTQADEHSFISYFNQINPVKQVESNQT